MDQVKLPKPYASADLPDGFRYPAAFLRALGEWTGDDALWPWLFEDGGSANGRAVLSIARSRSLVPFAFRDMGDGDFACFDGLDTSGNPKVIALVLDGSERAYGFADYEAWLAEALEDARRYGRSIQGR